MALVACSSARPGAVHILTPAQLAARCGAPGPACEDFRPAPAALVARVEERLTPLFSARLQGFLAPRAQRYIRQYWAVSRAGELFVIGNYVCPERVAVPARAASEPLLVDAAGMCRISALVPAAEPENTVFGYEW